MAGTATTSEFTIVPANEASWDDLQAVFGARGDTHVCQCQRYKLQPGEAFKKVPVEERAHRLRTQTASSKQRASRRSANRPSAAS